MQQLTGTHSPPTQYQNITILITRRGTVVTRWIYFVQAPGSTPGGEAHQVFALYEGYEEFSESHSNRFSYFEGTRWEPLGLLIYLLAVRGAQG